MSGKVKKIWVLTAGFGEGHNSAARNIAAGLQAVGGESCQVRVMDLFEQALGPFNEIMRESYLFMINRAAWSWQAFYKMLDQPGASMDMPPMGMVRNQLAALLKEEQPDAVLSTYMVYPHLFASLYQDTPRPFPLHTIVTDSISIHSLWYRSPSDHYYVPNEATAAVMRERGVPAELLHTLGFPVQLAFVNDAQLLTARPDPSRQPRVLYIINSARHKAPGIVKHLLQLPDLHLTVTVGRCEQLREEIQAASTGNERRVDILGWTQEIPQLLMSHHLVISKAGGATTQEAIAGCCPMIASQVVPGQEEGNYETLHRAGAGLLAENAVEIRDAVRSLFENGAGSWHQMRENIGKLSRPDSALRMAEKVLSAV